MNAGVCCHDTYPTTGINHRTSAMSVVGVGPFVIGWPDCRTSLLNLVEWEKCSCAVYSHFTTDCVG